MLLRPTDGETDHTRATERRRRGALDEYVEGVMGEMERGSEARAAIAARRGQQSGRS